MTYFSFSEKKNETEYFIPREDGTECEFEANNIRMGWYPHTQEELLECNLVTRPMLSRAKNHDVVVDVLPGYREEN